MSDDDLKRIIQTYPPSGRSIMKKVDFEPRIHHLKSELYRGDYDGASEDWKDGAHYMLNRVLMILQEYYS